MKYKAIEDQVTTVEKYAIELVASKAFWCFVMYVMLFPIILKKKLKDLKFTSIILLVGMVLLILIFLIRNLEMTQDQIRLLRLKIGVNTKHGNLLDSIAVIMYE